jgi:hypothetical protein
VAVPAFFFVPRDSVQAIDRRVDWIGGGLVTIGLILLNFVIADAQNASNGWKTWCTSLTHIEADDRHNIPSHSRVWMYSLLFPLGTLHSDQDYSTTTHETTTLDQGQREISDCVYDRVRIMDGLCGTSSSLSRSTLDSRLISVIFLSRYTFLSGGARPWPHSSDAAIHPLRSFGCTLQCTSRVASCQSLNSMDYLYRSPIHWVSRFFIHSHPPLHPN